MLCGQSKPEKRGASGKVGPDPITKGSSGEDNSRSREERHRRLETYGETIDPETGKTMRLPDRLLNHPLKYIVPAFSSDDELGIVSSVRGEEEEGHSFEFVGE